ncbi:uncharacterized protein ColSpa_06216 [Colletotrichum spaethianum]|uniref:Uncharacterized protein n=1 Tax=Colletotrichum spaethianum TaxID=700344 RepID=A0AA37LGB8_9PEZI|nr:uncharacterized protein ColSpa_06216 [Colletotrichum spaethianum]GKT46035.1 hypothetical protein ColSpa_06216 [Colletotrichum spaethianum]
MSVQHRLPQITISTRAKSTKNIRGKYPVIRTTEAGGEIPELAFRVTPDNATFIPLISIAAAVAAIPKLQLHVVFGELVNRTISPLYIKYSAPGETDRKE